MHHGFNISGLQVMCQSVMFLISMHFVIHGFYSVQLSGTTLYWRTCSSVNA